MCVLGIKESERGLKVETMIRLWLTTMAGFSLAFPPSKNSRDFAGGPRVSTIERKHGSVATLEHSMRLQYFVGRYAGTCPLGQNLDWFGLSSDQSVPSSKRPDHA